MPENPAECNGVVRAEETPPCDEGTEAASLTPILGVSNISQVFELFAALDAALLHPETTELVQEYLDHAHQRWNPVLSLDQEDYPYSDAYNALQLVRLHGHEMRYCHPWKTWLTWMDTHWQPDTTDRMILWQRQTMQHLWYAQAGMDEDQIQALQRHVTKSFSTARLKAAVEQAQSWEGISVGTEALDIDPWLLNCANGTLDLRTGILRDHCQTDMLTKCLEIVYDPLATCPTWEHFLWRIMGGSQGPIDPDTMGAGEMDNRNQADQQAQTLIEFQQRFVGYALTGDTSEQCMCVLHGSGANGKSTYLETLRALFGGYALTTPSASLLAKERQDTIPNDIARLRGARLVTAVEIGEGKRLDEELLKRLTGQDMVTARFLHQEFFEFKPTFKLMVACNHLPTIRGADHAIWRRLHRIPFTVTIPDHEQDKDLPAKLQAELPGILAWAVRGCLAWRQTGLGVPDVVHQATAEYRSDMDSLGRFLEECCIRLDEARVKAGELYDAYKSWCATTGEYAMTLTAMGKRLDERGYAKHVSNYVWRLGVALKDTSI